MPSRAVGAGVSPEVALQSNTSQWLMIDLSLISLDGFTCNQVGTSYAAFQFQSVSTQRFDKRNPHSIRSRHIALEYV